MAEITGVLRPVAEGATGDQDLLVDSIPSGLLDSTTNTSRSRLDVPSSSKAQMVMPTPHVGRGIVNLANILIQANGFLLWRFKGAAATLVSASASTILNTGIIVVDLTKAEGDPGRYRFRQLQAGDRDTTRLADNPVFVAAAFRDAVAYKCPTGQAWLMHGEHQMFLSDA